MGSGHSTVGSPWRGWVRLARVTYGATGPDNATSLNALLVERYWPPQRRSGLLAIGPEGLGWTSSTDVIDASFFKKDDPLAMHCKSR